MPDDMSQALIGEPHVVAKTITNNFHGRVWRV